MSVERHINVMLFSNESAACGGAEEHMLTLARNLRRDRFRVILACPPVLLGKLGPNVPADIVIEPVEYYYPAHLKGARQLLSSMRRHKIDILHSHMFHASMIASPLGRAIGVPAIIETPHVREHWRKGWKASYFIDRLVGHAVDAYIAVSQANADYLVSRKRLPVHKIRTIRNGIDTECFSPRHGSIRELRKSLGLADFDSVITVLARLEPQKGHNVLLDAFSNVQKRFPRVCVVLLGEGSLRSELETRVMISNLASNVRFAGFQRNVPDWLAASDFTVLPSLYEGLPLAAMESLAAAKPVIATAVDGTPEVVLNGRTGLLVPSGNASALELAMCRLLGNPQWTHQLGFAGRERIRKHFSVEQQVRETEALYFDAMSKTLQMHATADRVEAKSI